MMSEIEQLELETELLQVQAAKKSLELRIAKAGGEIQRLREHIAISAAKEDELKQKLKGDK